MNAIIIHETFTVTTDSPDYDAFINDAFQRASLADDTLYTLMWCLKANRGLIERVKMLESERLKWSGIVVENHRARRRLTGEDK